MSRDAAPHGAAVPGTAASRRAAVPGTAARVVVLRALGLGDLLTAIPALRAIRRVCPQHHLTLLAPRHFEPLLANEGLADAVLHVTGLDADLPADVHHADVAFNLHGRGPQSTDLLRRTRPQRLVAFGTPHGPTHREGEHEVHRWCRMLQAHGIPADPTDLHLAHTRRNTDRDEPPVTIIHPGAKDPARRWPPDRYAQVARCLLRQGHRVVLTGSEPERQLVDDLANLAPGAEPHAGATTITELAQLTADAHAVVCGDTGLAHLTTATRTPSVVLFGPVPPREWGPPPHLSALHVALHHDDGSRGDPHATTPDPRLLRIRPRHVLEALAGLRRPVGVENPRGAHPLVSR